MSIRRFWNKIGLPSLTDIQEVRETQKKHNELIESLKTQNEQLVSAIEKLECQLTSVSESIESKCGEDSQRIIEETECLITTLKKSLSASLQKRTEQLFDANLETYRTLCQSSSNTDELLRMLIVNTLQDDLEDVIARKQDGNTDSKSNARRRKKKSNQPTADEARSMDLSEL